MAVEGSAVPVYHSPTGAARDNKCRGSGRRSLNMSSSFPSLPNIDSPRTLCPRDADAFSYNPSHLSGWYIAQELWDRLPHQLQSTLAALQHSGAAVLTGYERLDKHGDALHLVPGGKGFEDELEVSLEDSIVSLPSLPPKLRTLSVTSSRYDSSISSPTFSSSNSSPSASPSLSASLATSPISPICLSPIDATSSTTTNKRWRERSFSTPLEPHNAYYTTELSHLRTESLPRLRHAARKVDTEWYEAKRLGVVSDSDVAEFEAWWIEKKVTIRSLDDQGKRLSLALGLSPTGMGWTAP